MLFSFFPKNSSYLLNDTCIGKQTWNFHWYSYYFDSSTDAGSLWIHDEGQFKVGCPKGSMHPEEQSKKLLTYQHFHLRVPQALGNQTSCWNWPK